MENSQAVLALRKIFEVLDKKEKTAGMRLLIIGLKLKDGIGGNKINLTAKWLRENGVYGSRYPRDPYGYSVQGLNSLNDPIFKRLKIGKDLLFTKIDSTLESRVLHINPAIDSQTLARGYKAFPACFLEGKLLGHTYSKIRNISYALFLCLKEHVDDVAKTGGVTTTYRNVLENMGWCPKPINRAKRILDEGFDKLNGLKNKSGVGVEVLTSSCGNGDNEQDSINEYLDKSLVTIKLRDDVLKDFLGAFGLEPVVKKEPEPMKIPFEVVKKEEPFASTNQREVVMDTLYMLNDLRSAATFNGVFALEGLTRSLLTNSAVDIERYKQMLDEGRKKVADILMELERCYCEFFDEEIEQGWRAILDCKNGNDRKSQLPERVDFLGSRYPSSIVWGIIENFIVRLKDVGALGELGKINCVRFWLKENSMDWTIEELEEIVAGFKTTALQEQKAVSC